MGRPIPSQVRPKALKLTAKERGPWARLKDLLASQVDGASLAAFRIAVGLVMALEAYELCRPNAAAISAGTTPLQTYYTGADISFHLPYPLFSWLPLLPAPWIYAIVGLLALSGLTMAAGLWYRASATLVFLTWAYLWVVESTRTYWQSHYYLELLVTFLMIWMPAARRFSIDRWLARKNPPPPTVPFWTIFLLRGQLLIAYFYAGVAKLSADWLLDAAPIRWVLTDPSVLKPYARFLSPEQLEPIRQFLHSVGFAYFISWTGLFFDLAVGFLLLARRTRLFGLVLMLIFHGINHFIIFDDIGWFPLVGIATALIFLNPDWPVRFAQWLRRPRLPRPDWPWFATGGVLFPVVGATLGWKAKPPQLLPQPAGHGVLARSTLAFIAAWLAWQAIIPLRHYAIAGDGRFTYEGMSFSWRLKAEARHAQGHHLFIRDSAIIPESRVPHINWSEWRGDKVVYRRLAAGAVNWPQMPEIVVLLEPLFGERILYNISAAPEGARNESAARERIAAIWQALYGRSPDSIRPSVSLPSAFRSAATVLRASMPQSPHAAQAEELVSRFEQLERGTLRGDGAMATVRDTRSFVTELLTRPIPEPVRAPLQALQPFALEGRPQGAGLFVIDDKALLRSVPGQPPRLDLKAWRNPSPNAGPSRPSDSYSKDATVIHVADVGVQAKDLLPQICIFDSQDAPEQPPFIWWNSVRDLTPSKGIHVSIQAFFLRRYAQRVAAFWERQYGRRPIINAGTSVSLNGRRHQPLIDPGVDLASVPVSYFRHNRWIKDLEEPRIPRELLAEGRRPPGF